MAFVEERVRVRRAGEEPLAELTRLDWFVAHAPEPTVEEINAQAEQDRMRNPHGDSYKQPRRSRTEIVADLKLAHAEAMVQAIANRRR